jgi:hypothetical protein
LRKFTKLKRITCIAVLLILLFTELTMGAPSNIAITPNSIPNPVNNQITNQNVLAETVPQQEGVNGTIDPNYKIDYQEISQNKYNVLYADMKTGLFALKNLTSGKIWYSTPNDSELDTTTKGIKRMEVRSQIVVDYIDKSNEAASKNTVSQNSQSSCINENSIKVEKIENGIQVTYKFNDLGFSIPVKYVLKDDYLDAVVETEKIVEGNKAFLVDIKLLPTFGAGNLAETGYLFIPDGSGAIVNFNNKDSVEHDYKQPIYGNELANPPLKKILNSQSIRMPVFGIVSGNEALMGIVAQGSGSGSIDAFNSSKSFGYNSVYSEVDLRTVSEITNSFTNKQITRYSRIPSLLTSYEVRYYPLTGDNASYVGMASKYRQYLIDEEGLKKDPQKPALDVDLYGSVDETAYFLGIPYNSQQVLTSFDQAVDIIKQLKQNGVNNISVRYIGWNNYGVLNNKIPTNANPLTQLGGDYAFQQLSKYLKQNNYSFYPDADLIRFRSGGNGVNANEDSIKNTFGTISYLFDYMPSVYVSKLNETPIQILTPQKIPLISDIFLNSYKKLNVNSIGLSTIGSYYYSNLNSKNGYYRGGLENIDTGVLKSYQKSGISMAFDDANAYALPYAIRVLDAPIYSSGFDFFDESVPFYQVVLHGYVTTSTPSMVHSADPDVDFLKAVETGSELLYDGMYSSSSSLIDTRYDNLYSTTYSLWIKDAAAKYKRYESFMNMIYDKTIINHIELTNGVFETTFEGNIKVIVNYNSTDAVANGQKILAKDFLIEGGE